MKYDHTVIVFSHTSYADFYILVLYLLAYPRRLHYVRTLVKPQPFQYAGPILKRLGAIPSTRVEDKNGGAVSRIIKELQQWDKCIFLISPKGSILNRPWRSGYYHIARELKAKLMVAGLDYERKCVIVSSEVDSSEESVVKDHLENELKQIVPLFPEGEIVPIRPHNESKRTLIDKDRVLTVTTVIILLLAAYWTI